MMFPVINPNSKISVINKSKLAVYSPKPYAQTNNCVDIKPLTAEIMRANGFISFGALSDCSLEEEYDKLWNVVEQQQKSPTLEDINLLIDEISQETGIDSKDATLVLGKLTQFGNMKSLKKLEDYLRDDLSEEIYNEKLGKAKLIKPSIRSLARRECDKFYNMRPISANAVLDYLQNSKKQIHFKVESDSYDYKDIYILDKAGFEYAERNILDLLDSCIFINLEGWDNGMNVFSQTNDLQPLKNNAIKLIERSKQIAKEQHKTFKEALSLAVNEDVKKRAEALEINFYTVSLCGDSVTAEDILSNIEPMKLDKKTPKTMIEAVGDYLYSENYSKSQFAKKGMAKYLQSAIDIYTPQRMGDRLKEIKGKIDEIASSLKKDDGTAYSEEDIFYIIPRSDKSYTPVAYQYAQVNNTPLQQFVFADSGRENYGLKDGKIYVILDDIIASGYSAKSDYRVTSKVNSHFIIAPVAACEIGIKNTKAMVIGSKDYIIEPEDTKKNYTGSDFYKSLSKEEQRQFENILRDCNSFSHFGGTGLAYFIELEDDPFPLPYIDSYGGAYAFCFPYMAPDNNAGFTNFLFEKLMLKPNEYSLKNYYNEGPDVWSIQYDILHK